MISSDKVSEKMFKILKGNGHNLKLFTDEGEHTVDPNSARRFYIQDLGTMINLDETDSTREIRVSVNQNTNIDQFRDRKSVV